MGNKISYWEFVCSMGGLMVMVSAMAFACYISSVTNSSLIIALSGIGFWFVVSILGVIAHNYDVKRNNGDRKDNG